MQTLTDSGRRVTVRLVVLFSVLVSAVAWISPLLGGSPASPGPGFFLWATAPLFVSLLLRAVTRDWSDLGVRPAIRGNLRWYALSVLAYPSAMVLAILAGTLLSASSVMGFSLGAYTQTLLAALPLFFVSAVFEEVGWRGYLAPKLATLNINNYVAHAVVAVVWTMWHVPFLSELPWTSAAENPMTFVPRYAVALFAFSILYGEIRNITGTFWPAVLLHCIGNSIGHPLEADYLSVASGKEYLGAIGTGLVTVAVIGLTGVAVARWQSRHLAPVEAST